MVRVRVGRRVEECVVRNNLEGAVDYFLLPTSYFLLAWKARLKRRILFTTYYLLLTWKARLKSILVCSAEKGSSETTPRTAKSRSPKHKSTCHMRPGWLDMLHNIRTDTTRERE